MRTDPGNSTARSPSSPQPPKLREARFEDYSQIAALVSKFQLQMEDYAGWKHLWDNNPAYREIADTFPMGWVLESGNGLICGYLGNIPLRYELEGKRLLAATTRSWVVDQPYRAYSPLLLGTYFRQPRIDLFMNTSINSQAAAAYSIFGGVKVPVGAWDRACFWITNPRGFSESLLRKKGWKLSAALSYPLSLGLFFRRGVRKTRFHQGADNFDVRASASFDSRFDDFWQEFRGTNSHRLLAVRSAEVLEWHFRFPLNSGAAWIYTVERDSKIRAYGVFLRQDSPELRLSRVRLVDFQCLDEQDAPPIFSCMLRTALDRCRRDSIDMLEAIGVSGELEKEVERSGPERRQLLNWMYCYKASTPALAEKLKDRDRWQPSLYDGDSSL